MKKFSVFYLCLTVNSIAYAEISTDGTLGAIQHLSGQMTIPQNLGTTAGNNLFHSFQTFNINPGESATFTGNNAIQNVISRVTGGQISNINGLLKSEIANASFYLINPAGVTFGVNAQVDVPAAFYVSTGERLNFKDGNAFVASATTASNLSVAEPADFGFLGNQAGDITIQNATLSFNHQNAVSLNAHQISFDKGGLSDPSGAILINAQSQLSLLNKSTISTSTNSASKAGDIKITTKNIIVENSGIHSDTEGDLLGNAGVITLNSDVIAITAGEISSYSDSQGNGGSITIPHATELVVNNSFIYTDAWKSSTGNAGTITLNVDKISLVNGGQVCSATLYKGSAGFIFINSKELTIDGQHSDDQHSLIHTEAGNNSSGNAGKIVIVSNKVALLNQGFITDHTKGEGNAGEISIQAKELLVDNGGIFSTAVENSTGNADKITINSERVTIANGGQISSSTQGKGDAGDVIVNTNSIDIYGKNSNNSSQISAAALAGSGGQAGNVSVITHHLHLYEGGEINIQNNVTANSNAESIVGGVVNVSAVDLILDSGGKINAESTGNIDAGQITTSFTHSLMMDNDAAITTQANSGNGGNLIINGSGIIRMNSAHINTFTETGNKGGDIKISADALVMNNAQIKAQADSANNGGDVRLTLNALIPSQNQLLVNGKFLSGSESGGTVSNVIQSARAGGVTLNAPQFNISGGISGLNSAKLVVPRVDNNLCQNAAVLNSALVRGGKGGIPDDGVHFGFVSPLSIVTRNDFKMPVSFPSNFPASPLEESYPCVTIPLN